MFDSMNFEILGLLEIWKGEAISIVCNISKECSYCENKTKKILFRFGNYNTQDFF